MRYLHACVRVTVFRYVGERRRKKIQSHPFGSVDGKTAEEGNPKITRPDSNGDMSFCTADVALRTPFSPRAKEERATIIITHADLPVYLYTRQTNYLYAFYRHHYTQKGEIYLIRRATMNAVNSPSVYRRRNHNISRRFFFIVMSPLYGTPKNVCGLAVRCICITEHVLIKNKRRTTFVLSIRMTTRCYVSPRVSH